MPFNVLIVDDEPLARAGLISMYDWERNGFRIVGEASDGRKALQFLEQSETHVVIADIAMPVMDGLELSRVAKERFPQTKIVLVSAHNEFEYAQQAMRLGVSDYLLKSRLEAGMLERSLEELRRQMIAEVRDVRERALLRALENITPWSAQPFAAAAGPYAIAVLLFAPSDCKDEPGGTEDSGVDRALKTFYQSLPDGYAVRFGIDQLVCWTPAGAGAHANEVVWADLQRALHKQRVRTSIGLSEARAPNASLHAAYQEALEAAERKFFVGYGHLLRYASKRTAPPRDAQRFTESKLLFKKCLSDRFVEKAYEQLVKTISEWSHHWTRAETVDEAKQLVHILLTELAPEADLTAALHAVDGCEDVNELKSFVLERFEHVTRQAPEDDDYQSRWVKKAIEFIHARFHEDLSLADVAGHVGLSRNYFSDQFRRHTGLTFIDYVTMTRMNKAKELLSNGQSKVYEIALQCGFNDVKHFSKQFKRYTGKSPSEYQGR